MALEQLVQSRVIDLGVVPLVHRDAPEWPYLVEMRPGQRGPNGVEIGRGVSLVELHGHDALAAVGN